MADFTHFNENGRAKMVDVSEKADTVRTAVAAGRVLVNAETFELIKTGGKPLLLGFCCWLGITGVAIAMQHTLGLIA